MKTRKRKAGKWSPRKFVVLEKRLRSEYGSPRHHNPEGALDDLVFVVLSRMTQEVKYLRTYRALKERLPDWGQVRDADTVTLEEVIHDAGLAPTKSRQIKALLEEIDAREGSLDLYRLHSLSDEQAEAYLASLPGVSRKTARCVMLYALGRNVCPVDAHVWRVSQRLGLAPAGAWTEVRASALELLIPEPLRASLHVTLISHGRAVCRARRPRCELCPIRSLCQRVGVAAASRGSVLPSAEAAVARDA